MTQSQSPFVDSRMKYPDYLLNGRGAGELLETKHVKPQTER